MPGQLASLNDDRVGRCLDRLFDADIPSLTLAVVAHAVRDFGVELDELHNDSTTFTFHGDYESADREHTLRGRLRLAATHGHNKDHRPDLNQLLHILTVSRDGAVPVQFRVESGHATDDRSHQGTWELLCKLTVLTQLTDSIASRHGGDLHSSLTALPEHLSDSDRTALQTGGETGDLRASLAALRASAVFEARPVEFWAGADGERRPGRGRVRCG